MKILTLNINSIRAHINSLIKILKEGYYDTILLQELKVDNHNFPYILLDEFGYNIKVFGQKTWNGVAILSKYSVEDVIYGLPNFIDENSRLIEAVVNGNIRLINVYMPNGDNIESPKFEYKLKWMNSFTEYINTYLKSDENVIIAGDFNVSITDNDIWNPKNYIGSSISAVEARNIMQNWLDSGWVDEWRKRHPTDIGYTWYGYRGFNSLEKNQGLRLDYFLTNLSAQKIIKKCEIDLSPRKENKPTDHCGLYLEI